MKNLFAKLLLMASVALSGCGGGDEAGGKSVSDTPTGDKVATVYHEGQLRTGLQAIGWQNGTELTAYSATIPKTQTYTVTTPPTAGTSAPWGWGAGVVTDGDRANSLNLSGFENGYMNFDVKGTVTTPVTIGFQSGRERGIPGNENNERPTSSNGVAFNAGASTNSGSTSLNGGGRTISTEWKSFQIPISELVGDNILDFSDITSPLYVQGSQDDGGIIEFRNVFFSTNTDGEIGSDLPDDGNTGGGPNSSGTGYILYTGQQANVTFDELQAWNGSSIRTINGGTYDPVLELTVTDGWGAFGWNAEGNPIDISSYTHAQFKVKTAASEVRVAISSATQPEDANNYQLSTGTALSDGWVQMEVPVPEFTDMSIFAVVLGENGTLQIADVALVTNETDGGTDGGDGGTDGGDGGTDGGDGGTDGSDGGSNTTGSGYILHTEQEANVSFDELQAWNGASINTINGGIYDPILELTVTEGWGAFGWNAEANPIDISAYTHAQFKVKTAASQVRVAISSATQPEDANDYQLSTGTALSDGWVQMEVPVPAFTDMTIFAVVLSENGTLQIADIVLVNNDSDGGTDGGDGGSDSSGTGYIVYTDQEPTVTFDELQAWNGASINTINGGTYDPVLELTVTNGWGAFGWNAEANPIDISAYTHAQFKVKTAASQVRVAISSQTQPEDANDYQLSTGTSLSDGWVQMEVPVPAFTDMTIFAVVLLENGTLQIADVALVNKDTDGGTDGGDGGSDSSGTGYIVYTDQEPTVTFDELQAWNGASINTINGGTYDPVLELTVTNGWGAFGWNAETNPIDISAYTHAQFKVKTDASQVRVAVSSQTQPEDANDYQLSTGTALSDGWVQMEVPVPSFTDMTIFAVVLGEDGTLQIADVALVTNDTDGGDGGTDGGDGGTDGGDGGTDGGDGGTDGGDGGSSTDYSVAPEIAPQPAATGNFPVSSVTGGDAPGQPVLGTAELPAISYGAFRTNVRSNENAPSIAEVKEDLKIMHAAGVRMLRTYNTQDFVDTERLLQAISELQQEDSSFEMNVMLGVWISALNAFSDIEIDSSQESPNNQDEMDKAVELAQTYPNIIKVIAVGNEAMVEWATSYRVEPRIILNRVNELQALKANGTINENIWITSSENWAVWSINNGYYQAHEADIKALIQAVDYVSVHVYPFHDTFHDSDFWPVPEAEQSLTRQEQADKAMERAFNKALTQIDTVKDSVMAVDSTKQIHIGETGWSTVSNTGFGAGGTGAADEYKQKQYFDAMTQWAIDYGASVFFFQAFDEPWKGGPDNTEDPEKHFGLIDIDGNAKYAIWDLVDAGAFDGITRGGNQIVKSNGGVEQNVIDAIHAIPYETGSDTSGTGYVMFTGRDTVHSFDDIQVWSQDGQGATIGAGNDSTYSPVQELTVTGGWGSAAWLFNTTQVDLTPYTHAEFKVKTSAASVEVTFINQADETTANPYQLSSGSSLDNGWVQMSVPVPSYTDLKTFALTLGENGTLQIADIAFVNNDSNGGDGSAPEIGYVLYTGQQTNIVFEDIQVWNNANLAEVDNDLYDPVLRLTVSEGWGAAAWASTSNPIDISSYTHAQFKVRTDASQIRLSIQSLSQDEVANDYALSLGTTLTDGWVQMEVPLPSFTDMTVFAMVLGQNGTLDIADVAYVNKDGGSTAPETGYIMYTGQDTNLVFDDVQVWNGAGLGDADSDVYDPVLELTVTDGWGALAWSSTLNPIDATSYTHARFKLLTDVAQVRVSIQDVTDGEEANDYALTDGTALTGGWVQMEIPLPDFADLTTFAVVLTENGSFQIADVAFVNADTDGGTDGGTDG
ncbi:glycoside hydrolase family 17 protein, partial [Enterovibrio coralii]